MTKDQLSKLKVGDLGMINRALDKGRLCEVVYINFEDDIILIRSIDGQVFNSIHNGNRNHRLINWRELIILENKEESQ